MSGGEDKEWIDPHMLPGLQLVFNRHGKVRYYNFWLAKWSLGVRWIPWRLPQLAEVEIVLYCIVLYLPPVLDPMSYDGARVLEALGHPMRLRSTTLAITHNSSLAYIPDLFFYALSTLVFPSKGVTIYGSDNIQREFDWICSPYAITLRVQRGWQK